ncbi:MAG: DUF459 domain-containing protein [Desulfovibrio sp.]|nr:DUF459 domain-containing protein [Desulfovibrio sp.]
MQFLLPVEEGNLHAPEPPAKTETPPHAKYPDGAPGKLASGKAFLLVACACLFLLILEFERATLYLDEFAPGVAAEKIASLLRAIGGTTGRLGEWESSLIRHLAGNNLPGRQKAPSLAGQTVPETPPLNAETSVTPPPASEARSISASQAASGEPDVTNAQDSAATQPAAEPLQAAGQADAPEAQAHAGKQTAPQAPESPVPTPAEERAAGDPQAVAVMQAHAVPPSPPRLGIAGKGAASVPDTLGPAGADKERKTVLLVGDSMMGWGLGHVLERRMREYPWITVKRYSQPSTGLCSNGVFDWPKYLSGLVAEHSPDLVIVSIGANDGSTMTDQSRRACTVFTPPWEKEYLRRAEEFLHIAGSGGAKVLWIGLPIAGVDKIEKVLRTVSRLQQDACAQYDFAAYVDVYAVLADKYGRYTSFRPGKNEEPVRIRAPDKVHVSTAGGKILTDYIMPAVLKTLGRPQQGSADADPGALRVRSKPTASRL